MNDNQKKRVAVIKFIEILLDLVNKKKITFHQFQLFSKTLLDRLEETDMADQVVEKANQILHEQKLYSEVDYNID